MDPDRIFEALASSARRQVLRDLAQAERSTSELALRLGVSTPAASRHLSVLEHAGLVTSRRHGQRVLYGLVRDTLMEALAGFAAELAMAPRAEPGRARKPREAI